MEIFRIPTQICSGRGALRSIGSIKGKKAVICIGCSHMKESQLLNKVILLLKKSGIETSIVEGIKTESTIEQISKHVKQIKEAEPDWIIAIGGGSVVDTAKALWILYENPDINIIEEYEKLQNASVGEKARLCVIPTTCGSGSEMTAVLVLKEQKSGVKLPIYNQNVRPDLVILDSAFVKTLPCQIIAQTGMDAFTHAMEAYTSIYATTFTDAMAEKALKLIYENILLAYQLDEKAIAKLQEASALAGIAMANASLGVCHAIAHKIADCFGGISLPHGYINGMLLPNVIEINSRDQRASEKYAQVAELLHLGGTDEKEKIRNLVYAIRCINKKLQFAESIFEYIQNETDVKMFKYTETELEEKLSKIILQVFSDPCIDSNPLKMEELDIKKLIIRAYTNL